MNHHKRFQLSALSFQLPSLSALSFKLSALHALRFTLCAPRSAPRAIRSALYALLVFTPLYLGAVQGWAVTTIHMVTLMALTVFLLEKSLSWDWAWIKTPLDRPIVCLVALCLVSSLFSVHHRTSLWATILLLNYVTIYYLVIHTVRTRSQVRGIIYVIIGMAAFLSIIGLLKKFGVNPFPWWEYSRLKQGTDLIATYGNHNHLAGYMEMALPLILGLFLTGFKKGRLFFIIYLTLIILAALILSLSRGGWIGAFLGVAFMCYALFTSRHFHRKGFLSALIGGTLALVLIVLASTPVVERVLTATEKGEEASFHSRVTAWKGAMDMIDDYPPLGTGPGTFGTVITQYQPPGLDSHFTMAHNDYLHFTAEVGFPLMPIIVWMIIALYRRGIKKFKNPSRLVRGITLGAMSGITAILFHSIIDFNFHIPANALLFTVLAALVAAPLPELPKDPWAHNAKR